MNDPKEKPTGGSDAAPAPVQQSWKSEDGLLAFDFTFTYNDKGLLTTILITPGTPQPEEPQDANPPAALEPLLFKEIRNDARLAVDTLDLKGNRLEGSFTLALGVRFKERTDDGGIFFDLHYGEHGFHHLEGVFVTFPINQATG